MSPKQVKITPSARGRSRSPSSTRPIGITQTGQPGPWTSSTFVGQQVVDPVLVDRVRVPAADLHHLVVAARLDRGEDLAGQRRGRARRRGTRRRTSRAASSPSARSPCRRGRAAGRPAPTGSTSAISTVAASPSSSAQQREAARRVDAERPSSATPSSPQVMQWSCAAGLGRVGCDSLTRSRSPSAPRAPARSPRPSARAAAGGERLLLVDLGDREADVDQDPVAGADALAVVVEQADVDVAANARDIDLREAVVSSTNSMTCPGIARHIWTEIPSLTWSHCLVAGLHEAMRRRIRAVLSRRLAAS